MAKEGDIATRFEVGYAVTTTPRGVLVRTAAGEKLVMNGLNARVGAGAQVLIARNEQGSRILTKQHR